MPDGAKMKSRNVLVASAVAVVMLAAGCSSGSGAGTPRLKLEKANIVVDAFPAIDSAGLYIAQIDGLTRTRSQVRDLPGGTPPGPPYPQSAEKKGAEEHDNADDQQVQQALDDDSHDAKRDRHDQQEQEKGNHPILRSVWLLTLAAQRRASRRSPEAPGW
jgi:hypothetical protein